MMQIFITCKLQIACLIILLFVGWIFLKQGTHIDQKMGQKNCNPRFDRMFILSEFCVLFDGITAYTVNHLGQIPAVINIIAHLIFLFLYQYFIFQHFMYWVEITDSLASKWQMKLLFQLPFYISSIITLLFIGKLEYREGIYTNYSMGISVYACYISVALYSLASFLLFLNKSFYLEQKKKTCFLLIHIFVLAITFFQVFYKEALVTALSAVLIVLGLYLIMENPTTKSLQRYHEEMIMGFATLVENKDDNTGGHIRRTSKYAVIIARELQQNFYYRRIITKDFMEDLRKAAPMHDIGKIGIPDRILQKPEKLTDEEYSIMKKHAEIGGNIIKKTFGHLAEDEYENMAYQVAVSHHEKWNGKGYPQGLKETEIPLAARIMAVADVFDAVSAKRCYRDALPLETCFEIIKKGRGTDFDPDVVDAFFARKDEIAAVANTNSEN